METEALLAALAQWDVPGPWRVTPLAHGTNNLVFRAESPADSYVAVVARNHADPGRLRFEHAVLRRLAAMELPFAVPAPLATASGDTCARVVRVARGDDGDALVTLVTLVTLTPLIPGEHPEREDIPRAEAAGDALGLLDGALRVVGEAGGEVGGEWATSWRSYGDLEHCHPLVPDPCHAIEELPVAPGDVRRLVARYDWLMARVPHLYATLPRQLVHEDYDPSNMLMVGDRVTGVLDFEFCARDLRVMDLNVALSWWPVRVLGTGDEWPIIAAFTRGYARHIRLSQEEIAALPVLYELRAYTSLIHRLGRYRQGLSPLEAVTERAEAALAREEWLRAHGSRLVDTVGALMGR